jgi:hypothetical protein
MAEIAELHDIGYTASGWPSRPGYYTLRFRDDGGNELVAHVFDRPGFVTVAPSDCRVGTGATTDQMINFNPRVYEAELREIIAMRGTRIDLPRSQFIRAAEKYGVLDVADWYGQELMVRANIKGKDFVARYRVVGLVRNSNDRVIVECLTSKGKLRRLPLDHARRYMAVTSGTPTPQKRPRGRVLDLGG